MIVPDRDCVLLLEEVRETVREGEFDGVLDWVDVTDAVLGGDAPLERVAVSLDVTEPLFELVGVVVGEPERVRDDDVVPDREFVPERELV